MCDSTGSTISPIYAPRTRPINLYSALDAKSRSERKDHDMHCITYSFNLLTIISPRHNFLRPHICTFPLTPSPPHLNHSALLLTALPSFLPSIPNHPTDPQQSHPPPSTPTSQPAAPPLSSPLRGEPSFITELASLPASHKQDGVRHRRCPSTQGNTDPYTCTCIHGDYIGREQEEKEEKVRCVPRQDLRSVLVGSLSTSQKEGRGGERRREEERGGERRREEEREAEGKEGKGREWGRRASCMPVSAFRIDGAGPGLGPGRRAAPRRATPRRSADLRLSCVRAIVRARRRASRRERTHPASFAV